MRGVGEEKKMQLESDCLATNKHALLHLTTSLSAVVLGDRLRSLEHGLTLNQFYGAHNQGCRSQGFCQRTNIKIALVSQDKVKMPCSRTSASYCNQDENVHASREFKIVNRKFLVALRS